MKTRVALILLAFTWLSCADKNDVVKPEGTDYIAADVNGKIFHYTQSGVLANDAHVDIYFTDSSKANLGWSIYLNGVNLRKITYPFKLRTISAENTVGIFSTEIVDNTPSTIRYVNWMAILGTEGATPFEATLTSFDGTHLTGTFHGTGVQIGEVTGPAIFANGKFSATIKFSKP